jgi:hypothetical protein
MFILNKTISFVLDIHIEMDRLRWTEKSITFRSLVNNPSIQKPALGNLFI